MAHTIVFHPALFALDPEHRRVLEAELSQYLAHHDVTGLRIPLHQGKFVAHRDGDGWQIRPGQSAEANNRANLLLAIQTWLDLNPSLQDLTTVTDVITDILGRQLTITRKAGRP